MRESNHETRNTIHEIRNTKTEALEAMKILVIGSGGREHALIWKIAQSPMVSEMFCAPGNAGIEGLSTIVDLNYRF